MKKSLILLSTALIPLVSCAGHTHTFINCKCSGCGEHEPTDKYLPSLIEEYAGDEDFKLETVSYEYDEDLLGYTKTKEYFGNSSPSKCVETCRYKNDDFKEFTHTTYSYEFDTSINDYYLEFVDKEEITILDDNNSFICDRYSYYEDAERFAFLNRKETRYNSRGQVVLEGWLELSPYYSGEYCYTTKYVYEYDDEGYPTGVYYYDYEDSVGDELYLYAKDIYTYNDDKTQCREEDLYRDDKYSEFDLTYYSLINISNEDGLIVFDCQNYDTSDTPLNKNVYKYTEDWVRVYTYFAGAEEYEYFKLNDNHQVIHYEYGFDPQHPRQYVDLTYSSNSLLSNCEIDDLYYTSSCSFEYNELNQITYAESTEIDKETSDEYDRHSVITYSTLQDGLLLEHLDFMVSFYSGYIGATVAEFEY